MLRPSALVRNCMSVRPHSFGLTVPPFSNNLRTSVVEFRKWQKQVLEFQAERNLSDEDVSYFFYHSLVGIARMLREDLSAVDFAASDGLPRIWRRLGRVFDCPPLERWHLVHGQ